MQLADTALGRSFKAVFWLLLVKNVLEYIKKLDQTKES